VVALSRLEPLQEWPRSQATEDLAGRRSSGLDLRERSVQEDCHVDGGHGLESGQPGLVPPSERFAV